MDTAYLYRNRNLNGMGLFWDDNLDVPTIDLDAPVEEYPVYDARDYWATGDSYNSIDSTVLDARDAWAEYGGTPVYSGTTDSSWSWRDVLQTGTDILKTGAGIAQEYLRYQTATLPGGGRIFTRYDQYGQPVTGGRTVMLPGGGIVGTLKNNMPLVVAGGVLLAVLATQKRR